MTGRITVVLSVSAVVLLAGVSLLLACCGGESRKSPADRSAVPEHPAGSVPLPHVPDELVTPGERAGWLSGHYWDLMDFSNHAFSLDTAFMEQSFANFAGVLAQVEQGRRDLAVRRMMSQASVDSAAYTFIGEIADRYLYDPESPVYDEASYLPLVEWRLERGEGERERLKAVAEDLRRNMPGSMAPDFSFLTRGGGREHLLRPGEGGKIILIFYEPDCERCRHMVARLREDRGLSELIARGEMRLVLVYQGDDIELWREHAATLPAEWEVGIDERGEIDARELYTVRLTPTVYMLEADGKVIAKDYRNL